MKSNLNWHWRNQGKGHAVSLICLPHAFSLFFSLPPSLSLSLSLSHSHTHTQTHAHTQARTHLRTHAEPSICSFSSSSSSSFFFFLSLICFGSGLGDRHLTDFLTTERFAITWLGNVLLREKCDWLPDYGTFWWERNVADYLITERFGERDMWLITWIRNVLVREMWLTTWLRNVLAREKCDWLPDYGTFWWKRHVTDYLTTERFGEREMWLITWLRNILPFFRDRGQSFFFFF